MASDARGYSWPAFGLQNAAAVRHGAWSTRRVDPVAAEVIAGVLERRPDLAEHPEALHAWARAEARCLLFADYLCDRDICSDEATRVLRHVGTFERLANELRGRLGLDPSSEARLVTARADAARQVVDLDGIRARGRRAIEARAR
jgi:hypothetical protein